MYVDIYTTDGDHYRGIKCGSESGMLFLVNPVQINLAQDLGIDDGSIMPDDEMASDAGSEVGKGDEAVRILQLSLSKIDRIEPVN